MKTKFEKMLEHLVNEDREGAEQLFHEIVVAKSREIYESLLEDDLENEEEFGGDPTDDFESDVEVDGDEEDDLGASDDDMEDDDEEFGDGEDDEELEDRIVDLEDALDDLKAEFEQLMSDSEDEEFSDEEVDSMDDMEGDEESADDAGEDDFDIETDDEQPLKDSVETMREYVEKVSKPTPGDNGSNTRSPVANKNNMGGTSQNIARGDKEPESKTAPKAEVKDAGNRNKPGGKVSKLNKSQSPNMKSSDSEKSLLGKK